MGNQAIRPAALLMAWLLMAWLLMAWLIAAGVTSPARAAWFDIRPYAFVPAADAPVTSGIDTDSNTIIGTLQTGIVARQVEVSRELTELVATDGKSPALTVMNVTEGIARHIALPAPAQRLVLGSTGKLLATFDPAGGAIMLVDLDNERLAASVVGLPKLRDVMFGDKDVLPYIAAEGLSGIGVIDVAAAWLTGEIAPFRPALTAIAGLARTPNGRQVPARPQGGGPISIIDAEQGVPVSQIASSADPAGIFPSGTGVYRLVPDNAQATLAVFRSEKLLDPVALKGAAGVSSVYTAWLDSVAFVPSATRRSVLVYDLIGMRLVDEIALPGVPVRGAVTADSRTPCLPLLDPRQLDVVDGETRRIITTIALPGTPLAAIVAGGWGICH